MIDIVITRDDLNGFTKGRTYRVIYGDVSADTVSVENDFGTRMHVQIDVDCVVLDKKGLSPDFRDMMFSYGQTIDAVGGDPRRFMNETKKMTVHEMMDILAPNGVRFCHVTSHVNRRERDIDLYEGNRG